MVVIGFNFDKISGERKAPLKKEMHLKTDMNIKDVKKEQLAFGDRKEEVVRFDFEFSIDYEPKLAELNFAGHILYTETPAKVKEILAEWKKEKKIEQSLKVKLLNAVLMKCNIKALLLSQELALPPPLRMPKVVTQTNAQSYIG